MIFHLKNRDKEIERILMPYLRYGDYIVSPGENGSKDVKVATYSGFGKVDFLGEEGILSKASSDRDMLMMLSEVSDIRFLLLSHPFNSFFVDESGNIFSTDTKKYICNIKVNGLPSQEMIEKIIVDSFYENKNCSFCEHYPLCGGYFSGRCDNYKVRIEEIRRAILRFRFNRSATVFVGFSCVNNCIFCAPAEKRKERPLSKEEILNFIERSSEGGCNNISFSGAGEPTLNPDLLEYVSYAKSKGISNLTVFTNGHKLTQELLDNLINAGVTSFLVSLHGNETSHDINVNRKGSYIEAISAIKRITERGLPLSVNTCITKYNITHLEDVIGTVNSMNPRARHSLSFPEISGNAVINIDSIPSMKEASSRVMELHSRGYSFMIEGLPLCLIKGFPGNMIIRGAIDMYKDNIGERFLSNLSNWVYIDKCSQCRMRIGCEGINRGYYQLKGSKQVEEEITGVT